MILQNQIERFGTISSDNNIDMRISNDPKIFMMLSSNIYEHKIRAVIRELSCNAKDAHTEAKNPNPFYVHLPTQLEPYFYVEDFGVGLDEEQVRDVYTVYGESTKTNSNDVIGALGLGSKSPFSYTDIFEVRTRKDGRELIYLVSKGESFSFTKISDTQTEEPNGVRVKFDINRNDYYEFRTEFNYVMSYFDTIPDNNFNIDENSFPRNLTNLYEITKNEIQSGYEFTCVMGCVPYKTNYNLEKFLNYATKKVDEKDFKLFSLISSHIFFKNIFFEMGTLEFMPSRERLALTPTCIETINKKLYEIIIDLTTQYKEMLSKATTPYDYIKVLETFKFAYSDRFNIHGVYVSSEELNGYYASSIGQINKEIYDIVSQEITLAGGRKKLNFINTRYNKVKVIS